MLRSVRLILVISKVTILTRVPLADDHDSENGILRVERKAWCRIVYEHDGLVIKDRVASFHARSLPPTSRLVPWSTERSPTVSSNSIFTQAVRQTHHNIPWPSPTSPLSPYPSASLITSCIIQPHADPLFGDRADVWKCIRSSAGMHQNDETTRSLRTQSDDLSLPIPFYTSSSS